MAAIVAFLAGAMPRGERQGAVPRPDERYRRRRHHIELMLRGFLEPRPRGWRLRRAQYEADAARKAWREAEIVRRYRGERALSLLGKARYAVILALAVVLSPNQWAFAAGPYYVATTGSDAAAGTIGAPFLTLQKAVDTATGGDTIYVRGGSYAEGALLRKALTIQGYPGDSVPILTSSTTTVPAGTLVGSTKNGVIRCETAGSVIDGLWVRNYTQGGSNAHNVSLVSTTANPGITIRNCTISGAVNSYGVRIYESNYPLIYNNTVYDNGVGVSVETAQGVNEQQRGTGTEIHNNEIRDNQRMTTLTPTVRTDDAGAIGINLLRVAGSAPTPIKVYSNLIHGNHAWSFDYGYDGSGTEIFGSKFIDIYDNKYFDNPHHTETGTQNGTSVYSGIPYPVSDVRWYRNVFYRGTNVPVYDWRPNGGNTFWKASVVCATTIARTLATQFAAGQVVDGHTLVLNERILIKNQTAGAENGLYFVNASGPPTRTTDANTNALYYDTSPAGTVNDILSIGCQVTSGTVNATKLFVQTTAGPITLGTTAQVWTEVVPYVSQYAATGYANGILMAVGDNMVITKNTFVGHDQTAVSVSDSAGDPYAGSFTGFICEDNIFSSSSVNAAWACFQTGRDMPSATVDYNFYQANIASAVFMKTYGSYTGTNGSFTTVAAIIANTPYEDHALSGNPLFLDVPNNDYRVATTSPVVNAGVVLAPFTDGYVGPAPDMGYFDTTTVAPQVPGATPRFGHRNIIR